MRWTLYILLAALTVPLLSVAIEFTKQPEPAYTLINVRPADLMQEHPVPRHGERIACAARIGPDANDMASRRLVWVCE